MMKRAQFILLLIMALAGCLTTRNVVQTRYYALDPPVSVDPATPLNQTLGIRPLSAARPYKLTMAYLDENHRLGYRQGEEWAEAPTEVATRAVTDALIALARFSDVGNAAEMARPDLLLTGEIRKFHEDRTVAPAQAQIEVRLELRQARSNTALWADTLRAQAPVQDREAGTLAEAMNQALALIAQEVAAALAHVELAGSGSPKKE